MSTNERNISSLDYLRLINQIYNDVGQSGIPADNLHQLYLILQTSNKIKSESIPDNIVTMNSDVVVKYMHSGTEKRIRIVYPDSSKEEHNISIYDPLALSILGLKEHDICLNSKNSEEEPIFIDKIVFQPEAHKLFNL